MSADRPKLRPRKDAHDMTLEATSQEEESQDPDYQLEEQDDEDEENEDENGDSNEDYNEDGIPAAKRRRPPSVPLKSKDLRYKPVTRTASAKRTLSTPTSHHTLHSSKEYLVSHPNHSPAALMSTPLDNTFRFLGVYSCSCLALDHQSQKQCEVLRLYGFYYHAGLNLIICPKDRRAVFLQDWFSHLKNSHKTDHPGKMKKLEILAMKAHVAESFGIYESLANLVLPLRLSEPLFMHDYFDHVRPSIAGRYLCPEEGCRTWVVITGIHITSTNISKSMVNV
jgi:hypothetical protein